MVIKGLDSSVSIENGLGYTGNKYKHKFYALKEKGGKF
jgi:hypothetical protein